MSTKQNDVFAEHQRENCDICGGKGEIQSHPYQEAGEIRDGLMVPCKCTLSDYSSEEEND